VIDSLVYPQVGTGMCLEEAYGFSTGTGIVLYDGYEIKNMAQVNRSFMLKKSRI
jgi:hypothetical protein